MHFCEVKLYDYRKCTCACTGAKRACPAQVTEEPNREAALVKALQRATGLKAELQRAGSDSSCNGTELQW